MHELQPQGSLLPNFPGSSQSHPLLGPHSICLYSSHNIEYNVLCCPFCTCVPWDRDQRLNIAMSLVLSTIHTVTFHEYSPKKRIKVWWGWTSKFNSHVSACSRPILCVLLRIYFILVSSPLQMWRLYCRLTGAANIDVTCIVMAFQ